VADQVDRVAASMRRMVRVLLDEVIETDYGHFNLMWSDDFGFDGNLDRFFDGQVNGLVGAADPGCLFVQFARRSGGSQVRLVLLDAKPPLPPPRYEDIVEVSVTFPPGAAVWWMSWAGETSGTLGDVPPGPYRLRVSSHGRDAGSLDESGDGVVDEYLLELWPSARRDDEVLRVGSEDARYWHREVGNRR
jgi:hypothetical protein